MTKALTVLGLFAAIGLLAAAWMPSEDSNPQVVQAAFNAQVDLRLHTLLSKLAREAEAKQQLASR